MRLFKIFAALFLGLGLCVALILHIGIGAADAARLAAQTAWPWVAVVVMLSALLMDFGARKWALLSLALHGPKGEEPARGFFLRHYVWQNWIGQFVPPTLAIVLGRGWAARHMPGLPVRSGLWNGLLDQAMELAFMLALGAGSVAVWLYGGGWITFMLCGALGMGLMALLLWLGRGWMPANFRPFLAWLMLLSALRVMFTLMRLIAGLFAFSLAIAALSAALVTPPLSLISLIPLTPGNLGIAEWGWAGALAFLGENVTEAALYALSFRVLILIAQTVLLAVNEGIILVRNRMSLRGGP